jgi:probable F420-dependent oxidoreductase
VVGLTSNPPKLILILSENWTLTDPRDLPQLVRFAVDAEEAGFDGVMVSEHIVLGHGSDSHGLPENPRDYALPGNQDPSTPWPSSLLLLAAIASVTTRLRLIAAAIIPPLRHPLLLAKEIATLDLLAQGRLVIQPTVSWLRSEFEALAVPFESRGELLDEHFEAWRAAWSTSPASFRGRHYLFDEVYLEPKPFRSDGPVLWFGGRTMHDRMLRRIVRYGSGFNPLGSPSDRDLEQLERAMAEAGRDIRELELVGGTRGSFTDATGTADLGEALASIPAQIERGFTSICIKPSQFTDDPAQVRELCREIVDRVEALSL